MLQQQPLSPRGTFFVVDEKEGKVGQSVLAASMFEKSRDMLAAVLLLGHGGVYVPPT